MKVAALIVAAGSGSRMGGGLPKQFRLLAGRPVLRHTVEIFAKHPDVASVTVVHAADTEETTRDCLKDIENIGFTIGGESRAASVALGLAALPSGTTHVLIHDGARCLTSRAVIDGVIEALADADAAAPALAVTDALWCGEDAQVTGMQSRDGLYRAQTPQGFALDPIRAAHENGTHEAADDVELALGHGIDVTITQGDEDNIKLTYPQDFAHAERILKEREQRSMDIRLGNGFDVHRFGEGDHVILCGVEIPFGRGLQGHSDADVGMHAITDAIYGALGQGDIGQHFPPSEAQWKGAASDIFLKHAVELAQDSGFAIGNVDCTLICEQPKIGPRATEMRVKLCEIMGLDIERISVKATTSERLGFTGREEGIAALATATLVKS
ncbi:bifunctional 2-C-methyl-D-erythritol 4-phosphate cytidylyltransferase/2-C-methyl-D-erythritol 2,4-cyclodiphosphate synthase [Halocynthiibacter sp. C4]|uniref:bifunctional 2-C-methyl-D-erythritol 4-phosphate cytidylyltransferase/2-C-methyl-D-erythritol 2,4-cyclodiphosphate synthase n=1 Tax=Halocynthiibacter sp. C4 TaxID=2992758 RepID=UPI00237B8DDF|nr:bifunctional 2-C-methyl-D-erythritol 4-phosphate cytidylyltransferase/2-C-methyl-D-erythritol 2,4-cyclodiphosphate synthase [Halocynthiibacter sp. C4]MDE0589564.1 bifunctional 2-C-methyl-D-erythritol 4-phosphate cytidylyltransferase/2-C-methyl-D-erythritol 2,4-cyclodiphosphate synthase [Halocynthiibacter sp. C4]